MEYDVAIKIQEIIGKMQCPKHFMCVESGFALLCKSKDGRKGNLLDCLDPDPKDCIFAKSKKNGSYVCKCPLRVYLKNEIKG